jgi:hemerythrin superfamily protein
MLQLPVRKNPVARLRRSGPVRSAVKAEERAFAAVSKAVGRHPAASAAVLAGAAGLLAGVLLPLGRKLAAQGVSAVSGDWVEVLTAEHRLVEGLLNDLVETGEKETGKRKALLAKIDWGLSKHAFAEETVIYPALRELHTDSAEKDLYDDHADIKILLAELRERPAGDPEWVRFAAELRSIVTTHAREEEVSVFPHLRERLSPQQNAKLTKQVNRQEMRLA